MGSGMYAGRAAAQALTRGNTDADGLKMVKAMGGRDMTKFSVLWFNVMHNNETYGTMVPYLRMKGLVPPSSEPRPAEKKQ